MEELDKLGKTIAPLSYDIKDYAKLGLLYKLLHVENPETPSANEILTVKNEVIAAIAKMV